jgi:hypothetical protein
MLVFKTLFTFFKQHYYIGLTKAKIFLDFWNKLYLKSFTVLCTLNTTLVQYFEAKLGAYSLIGKPHGCAPPMLATSVACTLKGFTIVNLQS